MVTFVNHGTRTIYVHGASFLICCMNALGYFILCFATGKLGVLNLVTCVQQQKHDHRSHHFQI